ncbi:MAG: hypothetical protein OXI44_11305 [Bacteroidota bacterium]|nr:hypothetical protein [Bacteroidota bacterium]
MNSQDKWFVSKLAAKTVRRVAVFVIIATSTLSITHAQTDSWYFEFGAGPTFSSELSQSGFNFDTSCYPGRTECQPGNGYRWFYQIPTDPGFAFRVGAGKEQGSLRIDANVKHSSQNLEQVFSRLTFLNGSDYPAYDPSSGVQSTVTTTIGRLQVSSFRLNIFLSLLPEIRVLRPYIGLGGGAARAVVTGLYFEERFSCTGPPCKGDISSYDSLHDEDLSDTILLGVGHAGFEYALTNRILAGIRISYTLLQRISGEGTYAEHKIPNLANTTTFGEANLTTVMATVRYRL